MRNDGKTNFYECNFDSFAEMESMTNSDIISQLQYRLPHINWKMRRKWKNINDKHKKLFARTQNLVYFRR